ncbi:MAG: CopD family protein, partial [Ardenticatenaceae bacterium]
IGGLVHFLLVAVPALPSEPADQRARGLGMLVRRFSTIGIASVTTLGITGLYSSWLHVGSLAGLRATAYGQTLLLKLALLVPVLGLAGLNLLHWRRRVEGHEAARRGFVRTLRAESATGLLVLVVAGLLTGLGPARSALEARQAGVLTLREVAEPLRVELTIRPPQPGSARFQVRLTDAEGRPYDRARRVRLQFTPPNSTLGSGEALAEAQGDGLYVVEGAFLSIEGPWRLDVQVQRPDGFDLFIGFDLLVDQAVRPAPDEAGGIAPGRWLGWGLIAIGLGLSLFGFWLLRQREFGAIPAVVLTMGLLLVAIGVLQQVEPMTPSEHEHTMEGIPANLFHKLRPNESPASPARAPNVPRV